MSRNKREGRWEVAQKYEKEYWKQIAGRIALDAEKQLTWYGWKASEFEKKLAKGNFDVQKDGCRILEVGSGPIGIVNYLDWGEKYAVDPLNDYYKENTSLVLLRNENVKYITANGEKLPFPDESFNVVMIDNVLDHVIDPGAVLDETYRVLSNSGIFYIELNIHTYWGYLLHSLLAGLNIDKGHPHSFTVNKIRNVVSDHKFEIMWDHINSYDTARNADIKTQSIKNKLKGYTGLSEFIYCAFCKKH